MTRRLVVIFNGSMERPIFPPQISPLYQHLLISSRIGDVSLAASDSPVTLDMHIFGVSLAGCSLISELLIAHSVKL